MLLGSSWCEELDGGNPLEDRSCLLNTARRAVYSQSLLDIFNPPPPREDGQEHVEYDVTSNLTKLCEVSYHRPREELHGRLYPEQDEITAIYMYTLQPDALPRSEGDMAAAWSVFSARVHGRSVGPVMNSNVDQYHDCAAYLDLVNSRAAQQTPDAEPVAVDDTAVTVVDGDECNQLPLSEAAEQTVNEAKEVASAEDVDIAEPASTVEMVIDRLGEETAAVKTEDKETLGDSTLPPSEAAAVDMASDTVMKVVETPKVAVEIPRQLVQPTVPSMLSAVLSYSPEDCSERIFEASLAAEFVRSLVATNSANIVADFLIAENPALACLADTR